MRYFFHYLYPFLYTLLTLCYLPFYLYRSFLQKKPIAPLLYRAGRLPYSLRDLSPSSGRARLWVHAVSVGEVNMIRPLVEELQLPPDQLFISTTTDTGQAQAKKLFGEKSRVFYFPLDWRTTCGRYLDAVDPSLVVLAESEIWPGFLLAASSRGIPVILINGRISDASFSRYSRFPQFPRFLLSKLSRVCMQSRQDRDRILAVGAPPERVHLLGNLKYDYQLDSVEASRPLVEGLCRLLIRSASDQLWVCGSTREGEEELLLPIFRQLRTDFPNLRWLVAPRHPHRVPAVSRFLESAEFRVLRRSQLTLSHSNPAATEFTDPPTAQPDILILDSIGELPYVYEIADIVFIGGSLFATGGHNIIEAANFGKPILFGPHMENFQDVSQTFLASYAALQVRSVEELSSKIRHLLRDPAARKWLGRNARKVIRDNQGAVERTAEIVRRYLG